MANLAAPRQGVRHSGGRGGARQQKFEFPVQWGVDLQVGARALSDLTEKYAKKAGHRDELPEGHQSLLYAGERRRPHGRGDGRAGAGDRRDHRRQPTRGAARNIGPQYGRARHRPRALRPVPRPAPLRHGAAGPWLRSAPSPTSPASPTSATASPSREPLETRGIDLY